MPPPLVIAHRGASGYRPEHTLEAYALAIAQGADFIEPDLVITRDGVLVVRHENEIGGTTNVAERFPERRTTKVVDGVAIEGWFTEDFTLYEIRTLRARERLPFRSQAFNGRFLVPTLDEVIQVAQRASAEQGRPIGMYPETKHPSYFRALGLPLEEPMLASLRQHGWDHREAPVFIQSFEVENLRALRRQTPVRLIQLVAASGAPWDARTRGEATTYADMVTEQGLATIAGYADGIGPDKALVLPGGREDQPTGLVERAHAAGLLVHPWTFRSEDQFLGESFQGTPREELRRFFALGVDGVFADFPDVAVEMRRELRG